MSYQQLDPIADAFLPLLGLALLISAVWMRRAGAAFFLLRAVLAIALSQQIAKFIQKRDGFGLGDEFPSTHFAVALAITVPFWFLSRKAGVFASLATALYTALMLWIWVQFGKYHSPLELLGSLYALLIAVAFQAPIRSSTKRTPAKRNEIA